MHTIALVTQKGGSGKSTLAIGLAIAAMQAGHKVCLLEADPQGTISNWRARRVQSEPAVETVIGAADIAQRLEELGQSNVTLTIIDTAAGDNPGTTATIDAADLCLIPARPSPADIEAALPTLAAVRNRDKPFAFVLNQTPARGIRIDDASAALSEKAVSLNLMGVLALPYIVMRNDHQDALGAGLAVMEFARHGKSAGEMRGLWLWVSKKIGISAPAYEQPELRAVG